MVRRSAIWLVVAVSVLLPLVLTQLPAYADQQGSAVIQLHQQINVDGIRVHGPQSVIKVSSQQPVFFGFTQQNVTVRLFSEGQQISITDSDNAGYWRLSPVKKMA